VGQKADKVFYASCEEGMIASRH